MAQRVSGRRVARVAPSAAPWSAVYAFDAAGVEVFFCVRRSVPAAYRVRDALLAEPGIGSVVVEPFAESYGGTA